MQSSVKLLCIGHVLANWSTTGQFSGPYRREEFVLLQALLAMCLNIYSWVSFDDHKPSNGSCHRPGPDNVWSWKSSWSGKVVPALIIMFWKKWIRQTDIFHTGWDIGPENVSVADVLINHAQYNATSYWKYLQPDIKWIVPVREPVSWMKSAVKYFQSRKLVPTNYICKHFDLEWKWKWYM